MPALAYDIEDNTIFRALRKKADQLSGARPEFRRIIFLADASCSTLRDLRQSDSTNRYKSGVEIIQHFLAKRRSIAAVIVLAVDNERGWNVTTLLGTDMERLDTQKMDAFLRALPRARYSGYQAKSLLEQGLYAPQARGQYLGARISGGVGHIMTVRISSRALQELLAGRMTLEDFQRRTIGNKNYIDMALKRGEIITSSRIESAGADEDDDWFVLEFSSDPAAAPLRAVKG